MKLIQHDPKKPSDCAVEPHDITHICDALRYYSVTRKLAGERDTGKDDGLDEFQRGTDYDEAMTGEDMDQSYLTYGGG